MNIIMRKIELLNVINAKVVHFYVMYNFFYEHSLLFFFSVCVCSIFIYTSAEVLHGVKRDLCLLWPYFEMMRNKTHCSYLKSLHTHTHRLQ